MLKEGELLSPEVERKKEKIFVNEYGIIVFESLFGEYKAMYDYLDLSQDERNMVEDMQNMGYTLIGERQADEAYPEYIKSFIEENFSFIVDGDEVNYQREGNNAQLIFIKITLPENKKISPLVEEETLSFTQLIEKVLANIAQTK